MDEWIGLAVRAQTGDRDALEALLEKSSGLAYAVCRARLGDSWLAEEAAVAALARAAASLAQLRTPAAYPGWLRRIAVRCAADAAGRRAPAAESAVERIDQRPGPIERLTAAERRGDLAAAVDALPTRLQEPIRLRFAEGLTHREIADVLGVGAGTVHRRIEKALARLRRHFQEIA